MVKPCYSRPRRPLRRPTRAQSKRATKNPHQWMSPLMWGAPVWKPCWWAKGPAGQTCWCHWRPSKSMRCWQPSRSLGPNQRQPSRPYESKPRNLYHVNANGFVLHSQDQQEEWLEVGPTWSNHCQEALFPDQEQQVGHPIR